jgi:hypothetical protein
MPKPAILSILSLFCALFAAGQDTLPKNPSYEQDLTIRATGKDRFIMNGDTISYDSCKRRLLLFPESAVELRKALKREKREKIIIPTLAVLALPAVVTGYVAKNEKYKSGWLTTTFVCLDISFLSSAFFFLVNEYQYGHHLTRAIHLYNAEIGHTTPDHPANAL